MATTVYSERGFASGAASTVAEAAGGIAIIVLSIIGLGGVRPDLLAAIAVTVLGAALLTEGAAVITQYAQALSMSTATTTGSSDMTVATTGGNGMMAEIFVGGAVLVLGILSLIGIYPVTLSAICIIAAGALLLISAPMMLQLTEIRRQAMNVPETVQPLLRASASGISGLQLLSGLAAVVLGIIALASGVDGMTTLVLVGTLILGAALTFNGTALTTSVLRLFSR